MQPGRHLQRLPIKLSPRLNAVKRHMRAPFATFMSSIEAGLVERGLKDVPLSSWLFSPLPAPDVHAQYVLSRSRELIWHLDQTS